MLSEKDISEIYEKYSHELYVFIYGFVQSQDLAEDILQDTFTNFISSDLKKGIDVSNIRALLYKIAKNLCIDHARIMKSVNITNLENNHPAFNDYDLQNKIELDELQEQIYLLLKKFDETSRSVFIMKKESRMTYEEISKIVGISVRTAKRRVEKISSYLLLELGKKGLL